MKQGLVQAFSVYIDTLFVCSATGFMLLITGLYNVQGAERLQRCIPGLQAWPQVGYVQTAMESMMRGFGNYFVAIALFFFAFTTIIAIPVGSVRAKPPRIKSAGSFKVRIPFRENIKEKPVLSQ